mmetsp:Transcript_2322/g.3333  ORF Transcript_2322/g.3333 Transcript_2322/m.3333 type:complete len:292 (-) Transcript_2322:389-1264(-)|eukprot:CAMPEP_0184487796 /NCGR_PEP_ID=MMETSP0113_2-20130426/10339_1 /TAXON_ID=91329 /ORGANISM="Norrisiella sphaerica, Strain BC52" /LENGTH=291 /DNA_ID=CAMNT_0026870203 /DNA_START=74 /DNA_END=949 /DNA_ORIENTATION=-
MIDRGGGGGGKISGSESKRKDGGVSLFSVAIFIVLLAVVRGFYKAKRDQQKIARHHKQWLPLTADELQQWQFTPLKSRDKVHVRENRDTGESEATIIEAEAGGEDTSNPTLKNDEVTSTASGEDKADPGVRKGWRIQCDHLPCQQLLPGQLSEGGIVSVEGEFHSCFNLLFGDDSLKASKNSITGTALLIAVRERDYMLLNTHEGNWKDETVYRGKVFTQDQKFQMDVKFLQSTAGFVEVVVESSGRTLVKRLINEYLINSFKKLDLQTGNFNGCAGPANTKFTKLEYLSR